MKMYKEVRIGIVVTCVIAVLIWGLNFLKGKNFFTRTNTYYAVYNNIGGLMESAAIYVNGFQVGKVNTIYFKQGSIKEIVVELEIEKQFKIPRQTVARIFSEDLLGTKGISLILSESRDYIEDGDTLTTAFEGTVSEQIEEQVIPIKNKAESLMVSVDSLFMDIHKSLDAETRMNIRKSFENIKNMTRDLNLRLNSILENLQSVSEILRKNGETLDVVMNNLSNVSDSLSKTQIKSTIGELNQTLEQTHAIMEKINKGEGSLGLLVNNDTLYYNLEKTSRNLDSLVSDIKANPKRYVHFSVFGKKK
jgi:phospholipid/cholesterol/gamma-HCH transport system substrate-binding protein